MADYGSRWDEDLMALSREFFGKHFADCSDGERKALVEIKESRRRLRQLDTFLAGLR